MKMEYLELLKVYEYENKLRLGNKNDGGYVIADANINYDCYISAGVSFEESFSRDFIKKYKMNKTNSFAFDGTISKYPYEYTTDITFINKNIGTENNDETTNLTKLFDKYNNIFVKMDIEGCEYQWIQFMSLEYMSKIAQMVIEIHGVNDDSWNTKHIDKVKCYDKLTKTHYLIHAHGNNYSFYQNHIPATLELTYLNKRFFKTHPILNTRSLPQRGLDSPKHPMIPDMELNIYPFVSNDLKYLYKKN